MDYSKQYNILIERAKYRTLEGYSESHHIIPRCMGGTDDKYNLVTLTAREHFIAHLLLYKIHPNQYGLIKAINMMCMQHTNGRVNNRMYSWLRKKLSEEMSRSQTGEGNSQYGKKWIYNIALRESRSVHVEEIQNYIDAGWIMGRKINFNNLRECEICKNLTFNKRLCSRECLYAWNAISRTPKEKEAPKEPSKSRYNIGSDNSQFGSRYMYNIQLQSEKRINVENIAQYEMEGWKFGQLPMFCESCGHKTSKNTKSRHKCY